MMVHPSITPERVMELAERRMRTLDDLGLCIACGYEQDGCEPDMRNGECEACGEQQVFGPTEMAAVMYPAMMEAPLRSDATELYLWATANASARHFGKPVDYYWKQLGGRAVSDDDVIKHGGRLWYNYVELAWEIRRRVISAQADRERAARKLNVTEQVLKAKLVRRDVKPLVLGEQLNLFAA